MGGSRALWVLVFSFAGLHLILGALLPLVEDEAYYALWATAPVAGYYDHPPMVAWMIAAGQSVFGPAALGVRAGSVVIGGLITLLTARTAFVLSRDTGVAFRAALWGKVMLPFAVLGFAATPDAPSVLFWTAAVWALIEARASNHATWFLAVGLFAGLGVLSKFTNLFFGLGLVGWLLTSREGRAWLRHWQVWAGAVTGLGVLVPFVIWNRQNDWIGLERQFGRIADVQAFSALQYGAFWLSVIVLITPLVFWLVLRSLRDSRVPGVLIWTIAPVFLYLTYHATKSSAGGQWLVPVFPTLAVMAALTAGRGWVAQLAAPTGLGLAAVVLALGFWPGRVVIGGQNPFTQGRGWSAVIGDIRAQATVEGAEWIATDAYGLTGQLTWYLGREMPVWSVTEPKRYLFRGPLPAGLCRAKGVFVSRTAFASGVPYFTTSRPLPDIVRREGDREIMTYSAAVVEGLKDCPTPGG